MSTFRTRMALCQALGMESTSSLPELAKAVAAVADDARRAVLQNLLDQLVADEPQPNGPWRQTS